MSERVRRAIRVRGVVQGVGFRPFVYRLATQLELDGYIGNDTDGVTVQVEGNPTRIADFLHRLQTEAPPISRIDEVSIEEIPPHGKTGFSIIHSQVLGAVSTGIPADAAICPDCLRELLDPNDRRYRYPFINCTNCGPRFTITRRIPYDRPQTSMAEFPMCPECQAEYDDPLNRRFHAQPNACWVCGPRVWLVEAGATLEFPGEANVSGRNLSDAEKNQTNMGASQAAEELNSGTVLKGHDFSRAVKAQQNQPALAAEGRFCTDISDRKTDSSAASSAPGTNTSIEETIDRLLRGQIMAIKGIGGFHLAVDATNEEAVARLRRRKHRYGKPLAVMIRDVAAARDLCELTNSEIDLLQRQARPIVLALARPGNPIAPSVAPGIPWLGIYLPYAPLQHLLFADIRVRALVMTSANLSEEPIAIDNDEARARLSQIADAFLMHNRDILQRCDDSVAAIVDGAPQLLRRARGYVPLGIGLPFDAPPLLAVGGHMKNVFALARGRFVYQSQHLGDLENLTGLEFFTESLAHLMHTFEIEPQAVIHDLHPGYLSTTWAKEWAAELKLPTIAVQHHHAHIAACMAEHGLEGPVIGMALDGTGYGTDGRIWGGEVLITHLDRFERWAHLDYVPMPGADAAVREPWRMAFAHLLAAGLSEDEARDLTGASEQEAHLLARMIERKLNSPRTSSLGRLFDAVAAVVLKRGKVDYEAQAAIELEGCAVNEDDDAGLQEYALDLWKGEDLKAPNMLRADRMWRTLLTDLRCGEDPSRIAARFHAGVAWGFINAAGNLRIETGINSVALSGGCLHNRRLARLLRVWLEEEGFQVFMHRQVSPGDGGLSYGQAVVAAAILNHRSR